MKFPLRKIFVAAAVLIAVASFAVGETRVDGTSEEGDSHAQSTQCSTLTFLTESLPGFHIGEPANFNIEAIGGTPPYHFEIVDGTLPEGLHMNKHGKITGKSNVVSDTTIFVTVTDSQGCHLTQAFAVRVDPPQP